MSAGRSARKARERRYAANAAGDTFAYRASKRVEEATADVLASKVVAVPQTFRLSTDAVRELRTAINAVRGFRLAKGTKARKAVERGRRLLRAISGNAFDGRFIRAVDFLAFCDESTEKEVGS